MRESRLLAAVLTVAGIGVFLGCQNTPKSEPQAAPAHSAEQQISRGAAVFAGNCASCHGNSGQGTDKAPALVGAGALPLYPRPDAMYRTTDFHTAMDIAAFVTKNMPPKESLRKAIPESDYWAVLAFALSANGVKLTEPVGPNNATGIVIHQ